MITNYWYVLLLTPFAVFFGLATGLGTAPVVVTRWTALKLRLPPVGPIYQKIILARFTSNFALLYQAGVTVLDCIRMGEALVGNSVVAEALQRVRKQIEEGVGLTAKF